MSSQPALQPGRPFPLGAHCDDHGVNFSLFSQHAEKVELCLFDPSGEQETARIDLVHNTNHVWHGYLPGLTAGTLYGYRVYGPYDPANGHRFNHHKLLIDPYARALHGEFKICDSQLGYDTSSKRLDASFSTIDSAPDMPKCVVLAPMQRSQPIDRPLVPWDDTVIYEAHVRGFTINNHSIPAEVRGRFAGMAQAQVIDYIKALGVTSVELLPVQGFLNERFLEAKGLSNYWGYNSIAFFAPHPHYAQGEAGAEFKHMVDRYHEAGLEVIIDVVYNHTAEGDQLGPTLSLRGIDNASYYRLQEADHRYYVNDSGCGNTININHPRVLQMVMDSLRYWVEVMGVDGFRFDLAPILGREPHGFEAGSGFFDAIAQDPILSTVKLIAEPWDIGPGGYQLGKFPAGWGEWNDRYRDSVRRYWRGDHGVLADFAGSIEGSPDLFAAGSRQPHASINLITAHDGFNLTDLVSFRERHNHANGEQNADGHAANFSHNYGVEGPTDDPDINALRQRQKRNLLATLLLSQGTPMLLAGDELNHTQSGNNNAYCQDNETTWLNWQTSAAGDQALRDFVAHALTVRNSGPLASHRSRVTDDASPISGDACPGATTQGHDCQLVTRWLNSEGQEIGSAELHHYTARSFVCSLTQPCARSATELQQLIYFNANEHEQMFGVPEAKRNTVWQVSLDTGLASGQPDHQRVVEHSLCLPGHSLVVLDRVLSSNQSP